MTRNVAGEFHDSFLIEHIKENGGEVERCVEINCFYSNFARVVHAKTCPHLFQLLGLSLLFSFLCLQLFNTFVAFSTFVDPVSFCIRFLANSSLLLLFPQLLSCSLSVLSFCCLVSIFTPYFFFPLARKS